MATGVAEVTVACHYDPSDLLLLQWWIILLTRLQLKLTISALNSVQNQLRALFKISSFIILRRFQNINYYATHNETRLNLSRYSIMELYSFSVKQNYMSTRCKQTMLHSILFVLNWKPVPSLPIPIQYFRLNPFASRIGRQVRSK